MGVPAQAGLSQEDVERVRRMGCRGEVGEERVGQQDLPPVHIRQLPRVQGPHHDAIGVDVGPGGELQAGSRQAVGGRQWQAVNIRNWWKW